MEWVTIKEFPNYEINELAMVRNKKTNQIKANSVGKRGYWVISLRKDGKMYLRTIHTLLAKAFIPNPENKPQVNHIDGNKLNCSLDNLEWATNKENTNHARRMGLHKSDGDKTVVQIKDGIIVAEYKSASEASRRTGIGRGNICNVCNGRTNGKGGHFLTAGGYVWKWKTNLI